MAFRILPLAFTLAATWSSACLAQTSEDRVPPSLASSDTIRLTDAQRDAILDSNTVESAAAARGEMAGAEAVGRPGIHGEIGAMVGSNGMRSLYGAAAIPLGDDANAVVTFESTRFGRYRR